MRRLSLRAKLLGGVLLLLAPVLGLLLWELQASHDLRRETALDHQVEIAETVASLVDTILDDSIDVGRALTHDSIIRSFNPARVDRHLQKLAPLYPQYFVLAVFDAKNRNVGDSQPYASGEPRTHIDPKSFEYLMKTGQPQVDPLFQGIRQAGKLLLAVQVPILDGDGRKAVGVVSLILDPAHISPRLANVRLRTSDTITLIDPNGRVALDTRRPNLNWKERDLSMVPVVQEALKGEKIRTADFRFFGDVRVLGIVRSPKYGWAVMATSPASKVFRGAYSDLRRDLLGFGLIALVALLGAWTYSSVVNAMAEKLQFALRELEAAHKWAESERARFQAVFNSAVDGLLFVEKDNRRMIANPQAIQLFGRPLVSESGQIQFTDQIFTPDGRSLSLDELPVSRALQGQVVLSTELMIVRPDGTKIHVLLGASPVHGAHGTVAGAVVSLHEITALKELERLREEWASIIAHDLRQPISSIQLQAGLLHKEPNASPLVQKLATQIERGARLLNRLTQDLLDVSRLEARQLKLELKSVEIGKLVHEFSERIEPQLQGHPVKITLGPSLPVIRGDPSRLEQIIGNLLSNAAKYGYPDTPILVELHRSKGAVSLEITNQGQGIESQDLPKLFQRFHRIRTARDKEIEGIGLGLYITKGLVEAHDGKIEAESIPGKTTTFRVSFPTKEAARKTA